MCRRSSIPARATPSCSTGRRWKATSATPPRTTSTPCSTKRELPPQTKRRLRATAAGVFVGSVRTSGARRAADVDHVAVAGRRVLVDEAGDQDAPVEGNDFAILLAAGRTGRADIILAARAALEAQFLRRGLIGEMHADAAAGAGADLVRLLALGLRGRFRARAV